MKKSIVLALFVLFGTSTYCQNEVEVYEATLDLAGHSEKELFYGFAEGDQIVFNFQTGKKKQIVGVEICEYPSLVKFTDDEASKLENKKIQVIKQAVYKFKLVNHSKRTYVCKIKIQRVPASDKTKLFNPEVKWVTKQDTAYNSYTKDVLIGYDTLYLQKTKTELARTQLSEELILNKSQKIHSVNNSEGNKTDVFFSLPEYRSTDLISKRVVSWAFWVGVGDEANKAWEKNSKVISSLVTEFAGAITSPLGGLLIGKVTELMLPASGEDVGYSVVDEHNKNKFYQNVEYLSYDHGKGTAGYKKFDGGNMVKGTWYIVMYNDNKMWPIDATVKVAALIETKTYKHVPYTEMKVTPRYEKRIFKDPTINTNRVPVIMD